MVFLRMARLLWIRHPANSFPIFFTSAGLLGMKKNKGSTLIEVLISTALVGTTAVTLLGFLHGGKLASKAPHEDYGAELCKEVLYSRIAKKDSILEFANTGGMPFKVVVKALTDGAPLRNDKPSLFSIDQVVL